MPKKTAPLIEFSHAAGCEFHTPFAASRVDRANGIIREVGLITSGVKARGHELHVDDTTLAQMLACANTRGKVPVKLNHPSAIENVCGYVTNFAVKGGKLVGDWHLLKSHEEYETMLERAERMPECFGMSAAFMGEEESAGGRRLARCEELIAFDCVAQPAAMPSGLFAAKNAARVDSQTGDMKTPSKTELTDPNAVPAEMPAWFQPFAEQLTRQGEQLQSIGAFQQQLQQQQIVNELLGMSPEDRAGLTDEDLAQYGITREEVAEVDALAAQMAEGGGEGTGSGGGDGLADILGRGLKSPKLPWSKGKSSAPTRSGTVPAGPAQGNTAAVAALQAEIGKLKKFQQGLEREKITTLERAKQAEVDAAITTLEEKSAALLVELEAKDEVIKRFEQTAGKHIPASRNLTEPLFEARADDDTRTEFEKLVSARFAVLKGSETNLSDKRVAQLQAQATRETVRAHKHAFEAHRAHAVTLGR